MPRLSSDRRSNYNELTNYIYNLKRFGRKKTLKNMKHLIKLVGRPDKSFRTILVGGSNGKGTIVRYISSILKANGLKVGVYTKPHFIEFTERIAVKGKNISKRDVVRLLNKMRPLMDSMSEKKSGGRHYYPTFFETSVAMALMYFKERGVDWAVLEIGLGGRLDGCNAVGAEISVLGNVSLVHTDVLGKTIEKIARDKAGIIKRGKTAVSCARGEALEVFRKAARIKGAKFYPVCERVKNARMWRGGWVFDCSGARSYRGLKIRNVADFNVWNAAAAVQAAELAGASEEAIRRGLFHTYLPGRMQVVHKKPIVVLDCAKDLDAIEKLALNLKRRFKYRRLVSVVSISPEGKDFEGMVKCLSGLSDVFVATRHNVRDRAADPEEIFNLVKKNRHYTPDSDGANAKKCFAVRRPRNAIKKALSIAGPRDMVLVTGSVFLVGEALKFFDKI